MEYDPNYRIILSWSRSMERNSQKTGFNKDEAVRIAKRVEDARASMIEVSRGITNEGAGPLWGKVPTEMILEEYPAVKGLPGFLKSVIKPLIPKLMKS